MLIGDVAIHTSVTENTTTPIDSIASRSRGEGSFVLMPAKNSDAANSTTPST